MSSGRLSTHVLDLVTGKPAAGVAIYLYQVSGGSRMLVKQTVTNADGRCDEPLLAADQVTRGTWELDFHVADYFKSAPAGELPFLSVVTLRFSIDAVNEGYHVPLLVTPWSYSTYRGS